MDNRNTNWAHHPDLSHPNWTGQTERTTRQPIHVSEKEPGWGITIAAAAVTVGVLYVVLYGLFVL